MSCDDLFYFLFVDEWCEPCNGNSLLLSQYDWSQWHQPTHSRRVQWMDKHLSGCSKAITCLFFSTLCNQCDLVQQTDIPTRLLTQIAFKPFICQFVRAFSHHNFLMPMLKSNHTKCQYLKVIRRALNFKIE